MNLLDDNELYDTSGYTQKEVQEALTILKYVSYEWDTVTVISNRADLSELEATLKLGIASVVVDLLLVEPHPFEKTKSGVQTKYKLAGDTMTEQIRCAGKISSSDSSFYLSKRCNNKGTLEHEGKMFCKLHHPPTAQQKRDASYAKFVAEGEARRNENKFKDLCAKVGLAQLRLGKVEPSWGLSEDELEFVKRMDKNGL